MNEDLDRDIKMAKLENELLKKTGMQGELKRQKLNILHNRMVIVIFPFEAIILCVIAYALLK